MTRLEQLTALRDTVLEGGRPNFCAMWHREGFCVEAETVNGSVDADLALLAALLLAVLEALIAKAQSAN
jgi:hypothetical protein